MVDLFLRAVSACKWLWLLGISDSHALAMLCWGQCAADLANPRQAIDRLLGQLAPVL